jgi:hypothetical protein
MTLNEAICALSAGKTYNEALSAWAVANGATASRTLDEQLNEVAVAQGSTSFSDFLLDLGYTGTLNEMMVDFFGNDGGVLGTPQTFVLTTGTDDGREIIGSGWSSAAGGGLTAYDAYAGLPIGTGTGDYIAGISFPNVTASGTAVSATLTLVVGSELAAGTARVYGEKGINSPIYGISPDLPSERLGNATTNYVDHSTAIATYPLNVKDIVNEIMADPAWASGQKMNFFIVAIVQDGGCRYGTYGGSLPYDTPPVLEIVT